MAISYLYTGEPMNGSAQDDFIIAYKASTGTDNNTVNGNGGDDLVIGDSSDTWIPNASYLNGSIATAFNLDAQTSEQIQILLTRLNDELGITLLMVTHDPDVAANATRQLRLDHGRITELQTNGRQTPAVARS